MTDYSIKRFNKYEKEEIIDAIKNFAHQKKRTYISAKDFCEYFGISETTVTRHGTWANLCKEAGLNPRYNRVNDKNILLQNLGYVWEKLGRQPRAKEMKQPLSSVSCSRYLKVFGNWYYTCLEFLSWKSGLPIEDILKETVESPPEVNDKKTKRAISLSLRYDVLKKDCFRCVKCGRSPATHLGVILHIDHLHPWAKGGETTISNLQTLCSECNLGKSAKI